MPFATAPSFHLPIIPEDAMTTERKNLKMFEDRFSKYLVAGLFADTTHVEVGTDLLPDTFRADVLLIPSEPLPQNLQGAGLFTRLTGDARCLVEAFSGSVPEERLEANLSKLRLALQRAYRDQQGIPFPHGVLWLIFNYWPQKALDSVFSTQGDVIEQGIRRWQGLPRETIYAVNTSEIELREDTLLFCLLGKGGQRRQAVITIVQQRLEPYHTLLYHFDRSFLVMSQTQQLQQLDPETLQDFQELHDAREEALRQLGRELGIEEGRELGIEEGRELGIEEGRELGIEEGEQRKAIEIAKNLLAQSIPLGIIAKATGLPLDQLVSLNTPEKTPKKKR
jgi:hypothetical protein